MLFSRFSFYIIKELFIWIKLYQRMLHAEFEIEVEINQVGRYWKKKRNIYIEHNRQILIRLAKICCTKVKMETLTFGDLLLSTHSRVVWFETFNFAIQNVLLTPELSGLRLLTPPCARLSQCAAVPSKPSWHSLSSEIPQIHIPLTNTCLYREINMVIW